MKYTVLRKKPKYCHMKHKHSCVSMTTLRRLQVTSLKNTHFQKQVGQSAEMFSLAH